MNLPDFSFSIAASPSPEQDVKARTSVSSPSHTKTVSTYSIYKRLANLALVVFAATICINLWLLSNHRAQDWHDNQANQLGRSLSQQGALTLAIPLNSKDNEQITFYLSTLASDQHVANATLYDASGRLIDSTSTNVSLLAEFKLKREFPLVFIEQVSIEGKTIGYLRLLLDEQQVMKYHDDYQTKLYEQVLVLMLLAGAAGLIVARAFYKFRYRHYQKVVKSDDDEANQASSQRNLGL